MTIKENGLNIIDYVMENHDNEFQIFIRGHIYIESLLSEIIKRSYENPEALSQLESMFYNKIKLLKAIDYISDEIETLLIRINRVRNKLAHRLQYSLGFDVAFELVNLAHEAGIDFSDNLIYSDKDYSKENYHTSGVINEVMSNTFAYLVFISEELFSKGEISDLMA